MAENEQQTSPFSLSTQVFIGFALGGIVGVFFGELIAPLQVVGDAYIRLLQMSVLPYMVVSLTLGIGSLRPDRAISLAKKGGSILALLWLIGLGVVLLIPLAYPSWESASFFSSTLVEEPQSVDFLGLYIPANPFYALANSLVPAVVLFSVMMGVALIGVEHKQGLLDSLSTLLNVLTRMIRFVVALTPLGVFAITASAAGTMSVEELGHLQIYLLTYIAGSGLLTLWILPALVTSLTPLTYRQVLGTSKDVLVTAFATGNLFIVLPVLAERSKELLRYAA